MQPWQRRRWFWLVQGISVARVGLLFAFVVICPIADCWPIALALYVSAGLTDFFDGRAARAKRVATRFGGALDVFGDRYFSVISCIYVAVRGVSVIPLAVILMRELYSVALRMVQIDGKGVMLQNRHLGGVVHTTIAVGTLGFIASPTHAPSAWFSVPYYAIAGFYVLYFPYSVRQSWARITAVIKDDLDADSDTGSKASLQR